MTAFGLSDGGDEKPGRPPVHYQISVTGRQAGFFFLLLLAALALSFFFGMRTGAAARKGPGSVATLVAASDLPVPTLAPSERPGDGRKAETPDEKPTEPALGFAAGKRAAPKETAAAATPAVAPTPVPAPAKSSPPKAAASSPPREAPASKAVAKGPFWVQVLATKKAPAADELMKRLKSEGFAGDVSAVPGKDGWFRVRVGPFKERARAEAAAKKLKQADKQIKNRPLVVP